MTLFRVEYLFCVTFESKTKFSYDMTLRITVIFLCLFSTFTSFSQAGIHAYTGLSIASNAEAVVTPEGTAHYGYIIGLDARLNSGDMYFILGMQYEDLSLLGQESASFFSNEGSMQLLKGRGGLGFNLFHINEKIRITAKVLGSLDYIYNYPADQISMRVPFNKLNEAVLGATGGLGVQAYNITFELEYEYAMINSYFKQKDSKFTYMAAKVGFFF